MLDEFEQDPLEALVVDDDPAQRFLLQQSLEQAGLLVKQAADGAEALALFKQSAPNPVFMDIKMPVMDGLEACSKMRQLPDGKDVPIVLITGLDDHESIQQAFDVDATDFITKPVNWPILNHRVRYLLKASVAFCALRKSESRLSNAQRIASLGHWERDIVNNKFQCSEQLYEIYGLTTQPIEATPESFLKQVHSDDKKYVTESINQALKKREAYNISFRIVLADGSERFVQEQAEVILSKQGKPARLQGTVQDITNRKIAEDKIQHLAYYNSLTGLPNRDHFKDFSTRILNRARVNGTKVALMFLDLDQFKRINDALGHDTGDELLKTLSHKLSRGLRSTDSLSKIHPKSSISSSVSHLDGDEFTILLDGFASENQIGSVARRVLDQLGQPVIIHDQEFVITGSMGIAVYPEDGEDIDTLLKNADIAMYQSKKGGRDNFRFYSSCLNQYAKERLGLESKLRRALERDELVLHYQPQVSATTGDITGLEALVRWQDPETALVTPATFIPVAEESGLILPIGEWVLQTACNQAQSWQQSGFKPMRMSVNLSSHQFHQREFIQNINKALEISGLSAQYLELEMTESIIMQQLEKTIIDLQKLKEIGVYLSIDDFGTGYSSMSYLKRFPLDTLKIDRSFITDITTNNSDVAIVEAIITLAKSLNLSTIAEGVEQEEQLSLLQKQGCDTIQGFYYSRPLPVDEIEEFMMSNRACHIHQFKEKEAGIKPVS